jgi:hypothetical protein
MMSKILTTHTIVEDTVHTLPDVTRVEVIDKNGRSYTNWDYDNMVSVSIQDDGKTIKIFINDENNA